MCDDTWTRIHLSVPGDNERTVLGEPHAQTRQHQSAQETSGMKATQANVEIRPVGVEDAEAIWRITQQEGVIETILSLPSDRLAQRRERLASLGPDEHWFVAEANGEVIGLAGLSVGMGRLRHSGHVFLFVAREYHGQGIGTR